ncbi:MAG: tyrosine-type recombinase/integrase [Bacteroidota bacterium]
MRVRFFIGHRKDKDQELIRRNCPVLMSVTYGGQRLVFTTGITLNMEEWDPVHRKVAGRPDSPGLNSWLDTLSHTADMVWQTLSDGAVPPDPAKFRKLFKESKPVFSGGFFPLYYRFMEEKSRDWNRNTYLKVRRVYDLLREYQDTSGTRLSFAVLDAAFLSAFADFLHAKGYRPATKKRIVNILVWFLKWTTDSGFNVYTAYRTFYRELEAQSANEPVKKFWYLTPEELERICSFDTGSTTGNRVRDLFCLTAFTGISFSALQRLKKEELTEDSAKIKGPGAKLRVVPLNSRARSLARHYANRYYRDGRAFPPVSPVSYNRWIRKTGEAAGLNRTVAIQGSDGLPEPAPLWSVLGSGTAMNTFIAQALASGMSEGSLTRVTGLAADSRLARIRDALLKEELEKL